MTEDRRHDDRFKVSVGARLTKGDATHAVRVTNISAGGCRFVLSKAMDEGTPVTVAAGRVAAIPGRIQWRDGELHGVGFDQPLDPIAVDHIRLFLSENPGLVSERVEGTLEE